jgi:hypothetical protein
MCDYSLHLVASRAAKIGDELVGDRRQRRSCVRRTHFNTPQQPRKGTLLASERKVTRIVPFIAGRRLVRAGHAEKLAGFLECSDHLTSTLRGVDKIALIGWSDGGIRTDTSCRVDAPP